MEEIIIPSSISFHSSSLLINMNRAHYSSFFKALLASIVVTLIVGSVSSENFSTDLDVSGNAHIQEDGNQLQLSLEQAGGAEAVTRQTYLYGRFDMQIKAVAGYAAGTVSSFFLQSPRPTNDEIDFELLGNVTGEPYLLHTNVWTNGVGNREEQMNLWFDPSADFHTYSIIWNPQNIIWLVDETPVRVYRNMQGVPYLNQQHLNTHVAVWNGEQWATRQGRIGIDWSQAPFVAYYRNYHSESQGEWYTRTVDEAKLRSVRQQYMVYDYCKDTSKYPQGFPPECSTNEHV